jgi:phosphatidylserine/phosphatidylglycerophosphate/cardiolipin synthase-like enzyme
MASVAASNGKFSVRAYRGDAKTLLAFNIDKKGSKDLAGFTVQVQPQGKTPFYLFNTLQFEKPADHAQDAAEPPYSTINAPLHKFRWVHVPGSSHQGLTPFVGPYTYTVTPRYFAGKSMQPLDPARSVSVTIDVRPFEKGTLALGFTRGFVQSQAFVNHFGLKARIQPKADGLIFDTSQESGVNAKGEKFTYDDEYAWLGFTARARVFGLLNEVLANPALRLDMFAYDLNEPDLCTMLITLARQGRVRVILDSAALHHDTTPKPKVPKEDQFEALFTAAAAAPAAIMRGKFSRFAHDKVFIVSNAGGAVKVLTGSTNFSITGFYVNSNHVLLFDDAGVAALYKQVFEKVWADHVTADPFRMSPLATQPHPFAPPGLPDMDINFAPHDKARSQALMDAIAARIAKEGKKGKKVGSVLFAVMQLDQGESPVYTALRDVHTNVDIFSYGISDSPGGIYLYRPQSTRGVLVTGKPGKTVLPKPFNQVASVSGHQVHHKLVVCGFNGTDPVVYCGSSNLAVQGETDNGDNLLEIRDEDVVTAFAIEAVALVDHFDFLDRSAAPKEKKATPTQPPPVKTQAAVEAHWFLRTDGKWAKPYFDAADLHSVDRKLFA